ncbi:TIGR03564 family F420-dependent LLM class oxidoreductase [Mycolicibacterium arseniciresistens]|uniref:TIGR03564 family F420-dependent LLM class oxidoreductase n=1 Tax=Mycolicibacterium arseniciresistens TaxID=3062257 RepID=A0ABT8UDB8_9MYCO|nr:TIGR03564 family F420-dependent LLM class oxidoreductase [Mycolicibacterium arseniciresistens]MDO3634855.1 TIGR03564 family F420-dependent LLM class oxidoreductase [Mycolicibacterium arseniciresistens]
MRIGLMVGSDRERPRADRLDGLLADGTAAESAGFASFWFPQVPGYLDAMTAVALLGRVTERIELGTAVVPIQTRHPLIMAQQALTTQVACGGRFTLGIGPSHHWIIDGQLGLSYDRPARQVAEYLDVLGAALSGPGAVDVENDGHRVHGTIDVTDTFTTPMLIAALGPVMLRLAGERAGGTILWMADERTIDSHIAPRINAAADAAGRPAPRIVAGVPVALCADGEVDEARAYASEVLGHADFSPNYVRLLEHGDAQDVGDTMAAGDESAVAARLRRYRDAGVTDLAARVVPLGADPAARRESRRRTEQFVASLAAEL